MVTQFNRIGIFYIVVLFSMYPIKKAFAQQQSWKFIKETNGIKVFYREIPNKNLNEVKIQTTFDSNLSTIVEALRDVDAYPKWVYKAVSSKTLKNLGQNEVIYYNKIDFPWPLHDRDVVIHTKVIQNQNSKEVTSISYAESAVLANVPEYVRINEFNSKWTFIPKNGGVAAEYVFKSNPSGSIPDWMINMSLDEGPIRTIQNFKKILIEKKYSTYNKLAILN